MKIKKTKAGITELFALVLAKVQLTNTDKLVGTMSN